MKKLARACFIVGLFFISNPEFDDRVLISSFLTFTTFDEFIVTATTYTPSVGECDVTPLLTANGSRIDSVNPLKHRWIAVSRDLLRSIVSFGDTVQIAGTGVYDGFWVVNDVMNKRFKASIDFLVGQRDLLCKWDSIKLFVKHQLVKK